MKAIPKTGPVNATVTAPPSKSYSVRALLLAAMSEGTTVVTNCLDADDTRYALEALRALGFEIDGSFQSGLSIGRRKTMSANEVPIFVGNAGTAMRFFTGWLAFTPGRFLLHGEERMHERPIGDLVEVLLAIGAEVEYAGNEGYPPLRIRGKRMRGGFDVAIAASVGTMSGVALQSNVPPRSVSGPVTAISSPTSTLQPIAWRMSRKPASPCAVGTASPRTRTLPRVAAAAANQ